MADACQSYLAAELLSDGNIVTYRALSKAQKIHANTAKEILYEFYQRQNAKKPGSLRATFLISGIQKPATDTVDGSSRMDEDTQGPQNSSFLSSSMPNQEAAERGLVTSSVILVREEDLGRSLETFEKVKTKHIYSLQPHSLKDLQVLSNVNRELFAKYGQEDPLETGGQYGTIRNPYVRRRTTQRPPPGTALSTSAPASAAELKKGAAEPNGAKSTTQKDSKPEGSKPESKRTASGPSPTDSTSARPPPKAKREASSIFQAFAKAKPKVKRENTDSSVALSAERSAPEDEPMKDASEDEQEEDFILPATKTTSSSNRPKKDVTADRAVKAQREEQLRQMMDVDDESEEAKSAESSDEEPAPTAAEDAMAVDPPAPTPDTTQVEVRNGRRRGRRRVMKKVTVKDEEGYFVSKEEPSWESFSEDENPPEPPKASRKPITAASAAGSGKASKKSTAGGSQKQGQLGSFFKKK